MMTVYDQEKIVETNMVDHLRSIINESNADIYKNLCYQLKRDLEATKEALALQKTQIHFARTFAFSECIKAIKTISSFVPRDAKPYLDALVKDLEEKRNGETNS
jgi:hypothetical protein